MKKRLIAATIVIALLLGTLPLTTMAASQGSDSLQEASLTTEIIPEQESDTGDIAAEDNVAEAINGTLGDNLTWTLQDGLLTIRGEGDMAHCGSGVYNSPAAPWYDYRNQITKVVIEPGVTTIADSAFYECTELTSIEIPDSVTAIYGAVYIPSPGVGYSSGYSYQGGAFYGCAKLKDIELSPNLTVLGPRSFYGCKSLTQMSIPAGVTEVALDLFSGCSSLERVELSPNTKSIGLFAFRGCSSLIEIEIPEGTESIQSGAFGGCNQLQSVSIPGTVTTVGVGYSFSSYGESFSQDGAVFTGCSNLTLLTLPENVTEIRGALCDKSTVLRVKPDTYAESYAVNRGYDYVYFFDGGSLMLEVTDAEGAALEEGISVIWYDASGNTVAKAFKLYGVSDKETYFCDVLLNDELKHTYIQPERYSFNLQGMEKDEQGNHQVSVILSKIDTISLEGYVKTSSGSAIANAVLKFTQTVGTTEKEWLASTDAEGTYSIELTAIPTKVTVSAEGYYDQTKVVIAEGVNHPSEMSFRMLELPKDKITISATITYAAKSTEDAVEYTLNDVSNIEFFVFNKTQNAGIEDVTLQYPYIYLPESAVHSGDVIEISAVDTTGEMTAEPAELVLDENGAGNAVIRFTQKGSVEIVHIYGSERNILMLFDASGRFVCSEVVRDYYKSPVLPAGTYTLVALRNASFLRSVAELSALDALGLQSGKDYIFNTITIGDGLITHIYSLSIPAFDTSKFIFTDSSGTGFTANKNAVSVGKFVTMRLEYLLSESRETSDEKVIIEIPDDAVFTDGSLTVDGKLAQYSREGNRISVSTNQKNGIIRFYLVPIEAKEIHVQAYLDFLNAGSEVVQPIGSVCLEATDAQIEVKEKTGQQHTYVCGTAVSDSVITVYDNAVEVGSVTANKVGDWYLEFELTDPGNYSYHQIHAEITNDYYNGTIRTEGKQLLYDKSHAEVSKVKMHYQGTHEFDFLAPQIDRPSYAYSPQSTSFHFTYEVDFTENDEIDVVAASIVTQGGEGSTYVPLTYDEESGFWIGTHAYNPSMLPYSVGVVYRPEITEYPETYYEMIASAEMSHVEEIQITHSELDDTVFKGNIVYDNIQLPIRATISDGGWETFDRNSYANNGYNTLVDTKDLVLLMNETENSAVQALCTADDKLLCVVYNVEELMAAETAMSAYASRAVPNIDALSVQQVVALGKQVYQQNPNDINAVAIGQAAERISHLGACKSAAGILGLSSLLPIPNNASGQGAGLGSWLKTFGELVPNTPGGGSVPSAADAMAGLTEAQQAQYRHLVRLLKQSGYLISSNPNPQDYSEAAEMRDVEIILDPSGYVYEAVPSNRVEGVKAEVYCYDYALDDFGMPETEKSDILWNAAEYGQVNPQYTDENGHYAWDVPAGQWLVKYSKEGYFDTDSRKDKAADADGYLPVPPPQVDVNVGIVSKAAPDVQKVNVYQNEVQIYFSQYMQIDSVTTDNVAVTSEGQEILGTISPLNAEFDNEGIHQYASIFSFAPEKSLTDQALIEIVNVKNYNGKTIAAPFRILKSVEVKPESLHIASNLYIDHNNSIFTKIQVLPGRVGAGQALTVTSMAPSIVNVVNGSVATDEDGYANVILEGKLPGKCEIEVQLDGTSIEAVAVVTVGNVINRENTCAKVMANIESGTKVAPGTEITLRTKTPDAEIYYTLDGTDPTGSDAAIKYTAPIIVEHDAFIIAYATKQGLTDGFATGFAYNAHSPTLVPAVLPTYAKIGNIEYYACSCGKWFKDADGWDEILNHEEVFLPVLNHAHSYETTVIQPTCTEAGYTTYICACGDSYTGDTVAAKGHSWDAGKVAKEPTETAEGEKTFTCVRCKAIKTERIEKLPEPACKHNAVGVLGFRKATCTVPGYTGDKYCLLCGEVIEKGTQISVAEHTWQEGECSVCGEADPNWGESPEPETIRIYGDNRFTTAFAVADQMKANLGIRKFDAVIVASGTNFADALSGSYLAAVKNAPILLSFNDKYNELAKDYIWDNLTPGGTVYILGGTAAVPASMEEGLDNFNVIRLAGNDRFGTNLAILKEAGVADKDILICTGLSFADSLSASASECPILLVWNKLTEDQKTFLDSLNGNKLYVIGGESAVSKDMEKKVAAYGKTERVGGANRFETSVNIAGKFFDNPDSAVLAYAWNYPDGLCGGALAATMDAPLILTMTKYEAKAAEYIQSRNIQNGAILGGSGLISEGSVAILFAQ